MSLKPYTGPLKAVVLDWAGTAVDYGCVGPVAVFLEVFHRQGVEVSAAQARRPMGLAKRDHIAAMCRDQEVLALWRAAKGREPLEADIDDMYAETVELMVATVLEHSQLIPGLVEAIAACRSMGLAIGSCSGYTAPIMETLVPMARKAGYAPDAVVNSSQVPRGRPSPFMCFKNAMLLDVWPMEAMLKAGDTVADIEEGLNAGMWTVAFSQTSNELGLNQAEAEALPPAELQARLAPIEAKFREAGAHFVVRGVWELPAVVEETKRRLAAGERP